MIRRSQRMIALSLILINAFFAVSALPFYGMEDNCILSFVVPKEKVKSTCDLDEKVNRRISAIETKVNIYKQQANDLQIQLDKERQLNTEKLETLEQRLKDLSVNVDMTFLIERRLAVLEKEIQQLQADIVPMKTLKGKPSFPQEEKTMPLIPNNIDNRPAALSNQAKIMIESEVKGLFNDFTKRIETYVQEQVILYNKVFNLLPTKIQTTPRDETTAPSVTTPGTTTIQTATTHEQSTPGELPPDKTTVLILDTTTTTKPYINGTDDLKQDTNATIFENMTNEEKNFLITLTKENSTDIDPVYSESRGVNISATPTNNSEPLSINDLLKSNYTLPEDNPLPNKTFHKDSNSSLDNDISGSATSRIIIKSEIDPSSKIIDPALENVDKDSKILDQDSKNLDQAAKSLDQASKNLDHASENLDQTPNNAESVESESDKNWKDNMILDQSHKQTETEERLKEEIKSMLYSPLAKVMSLMEKQKSALEEKIKFQNERSEQINKDMKVKIKELDSSVVAINLQLESISKGFQDSSGKLDKINEIDAVVSEIMKNMTSEPLTMSTLQLEDQGKKVKKLERLMSIYQQSLEHYRNETKHEYRDIKDLLEKETTAVRTLSKALQNNVTSTLNSEISRQNMTFMNKLNEISEQIRTQDENLVLMQLDLSNVEKSVKSKPSRWSEKDIDKLQEEVNQIASTHREFRRKYGQLEKYQQNLTESLNSTATDVSSLKMEIKLNAEQWIPYKFDFDSSRTECFGDQFVKRTIYSSTGLVGVVLCSPVRYKIFLSTSLHGTFMNIGDGNGCGEDHCEFVGGQNGTEVKLSPFKKSVGVVQGYSRNDWGERPTMSYLNALRPSPHWYECSVDIP